MGKPTKILHNVAVGVVLNDVLDPLIAVLISATLRFSRMASSGLGNVDLSEVCSRLRMSMNLQKFGWYAPTFAWKLRCQPSTALLVLGRSSTQKGL